MTYFNRIIFASRQFERFRVYLFLRVPGLKVGLYLLEWKIVQEIVFSVESTDEG